MFTKPCCNMHSQLLPVTFQQIVSIGVEGTARWRLKVMKDYAREEQLIKASHFLRKNSVHTLFVENWVLQLSGLYVKICW